ncbi:hypothetical protein ACWEQ3_49780 [Streptomyces mirabilis]
MVHQGKVALAGSAHLELVSGVVQLRPEDAMFDAMPRGWRAQRKARGLQDETVEDREQLIRRFHRSSAGTAPSTSATARRKGASSPGAGTCCR